MLNLRKFGFLHMKKLKPASALLIVLLAQINIFTYNYFAAKHGAEMKVEKDNKKIITSSIFKQVMARIRGRFRFIRKRILAKNLTYHQKISVRFFSFIKKIRGLIAYDYSKFRLLWFGCCTLGKNISQHWIWLK